MADKLVLKSVKFKLNNTALDAWDGSDLSSHLDSITINANIEELDGTTFLVTAKDSEAGLEDNTLQLNFKMPKSLSALDGVIWPLRGTKVFFAARLKDEAIGVDNPEWQGQVLIAGAYPIGGGVGTVATQSLTWRICTVLTRDVT
jgi:hypothetical protein